MENPHIHSLIQKAQTGDGAAWHQLIELFQARLLGGAQRLLGSNWPNISPRDLTQDTWLRAQANLRRYRGDGFFAWLSAIQRNRYLNLIRGKKTTVPPVTESAAEPVDAEVSALSAILKRELAAAVNRALVALDPDEQQLLKLRVDGKLSFAEVGTRLGLTEKVTRTRFHKLIKKLRGLLEELRA